MRLPAFARVLAGVLAAPAVAASPALADDAAPPLPLAEPAHVPNRPDPFFIAGTAVFVAAYVPSFAAAVYDAAQAESCFSSSSGWGTFSCPSYQGENGLLLPLAGPWMTLASGWAPSGSWSAGQRALLVADGIAQDAGAVVAAYGVYRVFAGGSASNRPSRAATVTVAPLLTTASAGLAAVGRF